MSISALRKRIFALTGELKMDDDARREMQRSITGKASLKGMGQIDLDKIATHLDRLVKKQRRAKTTPHERQVALLRAIWRDLHVMGEIRNVNDEALCSWLSNSQSPNVTTHFNFQSTEMMDWAIKRLKSYRLRVIKTGVLSCDKCQGVFVPHSVLLRSWPSVQCPSCAADRAQGVSDGKTQFLTWSRKDG